MLFLKNEIKKGQESQASSRAILVLVSVTVIVYLAAFFYVDVVRQRQIDSGNPISTSLPIYGSDSSGFAALAENLLNTGEFSKIGEPGPETFRTPGYPFILAFWKGVFDSYRYFPLFQTLLVLMTAILIYYLGGILFRPAVGVAAGLLYILNPNTVFHTMVVLSEISFVFLLTLAVAAIFWRNNLKFPKEIVVGVVLGVAVMVKPIAVFLPLVLIFVYVLNEIRLDSRPSRIFFGAAAILLCFIVSIMPWLARNHARTGVVGVSSVSAVNLFFYNVPEFLSFRDGITPDDGRAIMAEKVSEIPSREWSELEHSGALTKAGLSVILDDPFGYSVFHTLKTIPFFLSSGLDNFFVTYNDIVGKQVFGVSTANLTNILAQGDFRALFGEFRKSLAVSVEQFIWLGLLALGLLALVFGKGYRLNIVFLMLVVFYFAILTGPVAYARFRMPAEPFIFLLASFGFLVSMERLWRGKAELRR